MRTSLQIILLFMATVLSAVSTGYGQCQFVSPTVEINSIQADVNGNCVVNMNLGFEIDINNGNKIIFVHLWRSQDYTVHNYTNQNQPRESNILDDALATIVIDNDVINNNPSAPASQVFMTTYGPDPGIDDNTAPAINQVKDASDGLTYNRVIVNASQHIYRYTINNLVLTLPGGCNNQMNFTGDAWSSNANSSNPAVQCSMTGFTFLANDPAISSTFTCMSEGTSNTYAYTVSTSAPGQLNFSVDVYVDNGDGFFDSGLDILVQANAGPYVATSGTPFYSGLLSYTAPYATTSPGRFRNLWVVVKNMSVTNGSTTTTISNSLIEKVINTCSATVLPVKLLSFTGQRNGDKVAIHWEVVQSEDITGYVLQRKHSEGIWEDISTVAAHAGKDQAQQYSTTDPTAVTEALFYRLQIRSHSAADEYSTELRIAGIERLSDWQVSPNPSTNGQVNITLQLAGDKSVRLDLFDLRGRQLQHFPALTSGSHTLATLPAGTYIAKVTTPSGNTTYKKLVVLSH